MDNESLNWFRCAKCLADAGNKVLRQYLYFHASTCSLSDYHDVWQKKVKDHCRSDDLKLLWTSFNQQSLALDVTSQQIVQPLLSKWKRSIRGPPMAIRQQLSVLESWETDLQNTISKNATQQDTLSKLSNEIQKLVTEHSSLLASIKNWTKDFIHMCNANQLDLLRWVEQHNEKTSSLLSTFLQNLKTIISQGSGDLENALKTCQQNEGNSSNELKTNIQTSFISWQSKIDTLIDSWATHIPNSINQKILQNLSIDMKNDLPGVHKTCQVNVNDICRTWHNNLRKKLAKWNHQLQQVGKSAADLQDLAKKWHKKLQAFLSVSELLTKDFFDSRSADLQRLKARHILTEPQWSLIFPSQGSINLQAFDLTLLYTLLRNICPIFPPESDWSGEILDTDHSMGADLMRLKNYRNDYVGHISHPALPNYDFEKIWVILETILNRLSMPLGHELWQGIQQKITELRNCSFDDRAEIKLQLELINWYKSDSGRMEEKLESVLGNLQALNETFQDLPQQQVVLLSEIQHLKTQLGSMSEEGTMQRLERIEQRVTRMDEYMSNMTKGKIRRHSDDRKDVHIRTRAYHHAKATLLEHRHLVLHGKPGDGKTFIALSIIADLMEMYHEMLPVEVNKPNEWEELVDMKQPLIVFMDDALGKYGVSETDLSQWEKLSKLIHPNISDSSVFLIVCLRDQIALKVRRSLQRFEAFSCMFNSNVINISDEKYCLTKEEKTEMLMKYATKHLKQTDTFTIGNIVNMKNVIGFPQNCKIWSCRQNLVLKEVCANNMFLVEEIQDISRKSCQDYLFLVLLMLSGGSLSLDNNTEELRRKIKTISELCGIREELNIGQCKDIGHSLCNTFVEYDTETKKFRFQHDSTESAVFFSFGNDYPGITLELCSLQALTKMCCLRNEKNISDDESFLNFKITIDDDPYFKVIMERFSKGLESRKRELFQCIAEALVWQSTQFSDYFLKTLTSSSDVLNFLSKKDLDGQSLLTYFIYAENALVVKGIVNKISQYNIRDHHLVSRQILLATVNACLADKADTFNYLIEFQDKANDFAMFAAASTGNVSYMDKLLFHGGNLNAMISDKVPKDLTNTIKNCVSYPNNESFHHDINLLHIACSYGRIDMVRYLKTNCSELLHKTSSIGFKAAHFVARSENVELMKLLLAEELDMERGDNNNYRVLRIAAANGNVEMVKYLAETFPQMAHQTDTDGCTVLHSSGVGGRVHVLKALLEKGLDIMARTNGGFNVLHISAENDHLIMVKYLIKTYPKLVKHTDNEGNSAVHYAARRGGVPVMETLIQAGLDINARTYDGSHVLHIASCHDNLLMVNYLIKAVPQLIHQTNNLGVTVLHCACAQGSVPVIDMLLQAGSDIKARTNEGSNVLHLAAAHDNISTMDYLMKAYPQLKHDLTNNGWTVLHFCSQGGGIRAMELLLHAEFNIKARTNQGYNALHIAAVNKNVAIVNYLIKECPRLIQQTNNEGRTALHGAAHGGDIQIIETLIKAGSDITAKCAGGTNVFHLAVANDTLSVVKYLMGKFPQLVKLNNDIGWTSLHYACERSGVPMVEILIQAGVDITSRTKRGENLLHFAARNNNLSVVKYLIETFPKLKHETDFQRWTAVHYAAQEGNVPMMETLLEARLDITARTNDDSNVLHIAAENDRVSVVIHLVQTCPQLVQQLSQINNKSGWKPIHSAAQHGSIRLLEVLVHAGADITANTQCGRSVVQIAGMKNDLSMLIYLIEKFPYLIP